MELYIFLDFKNGFWNDKKENELEELSERFSYQDYNCEHNKKSIKSIFKKICCDYEHEKIFYDLENEKLVCKCIDLDTDKIIYEEEI